MCLAKAYVRPAGGDAQANQVMENVTNVEVDGDRVRLSSLLGGNEELRGRIVSISFGDGRVVIEECPR